MTRAALLVLAAAASAAPTDLLALRARGSPSKLDPGWLPAGLLIDFDPAGLVRTGLDASDDLAFLAMVGADDRSRVLGATITYGNALLSHTKADAYLLHRLAGVLDTVPRAAGNADWTGRPSLTTPSPASELIAEQVFREPAGSVIVVCLGPLHNLASAFVQYPALAGRLRAVVMSEGVRGLGGVDVNLAGADREATRTVLGADVPRVLVPWRACARAPMTAELLEAARRVCPGPAACEYLPQLRRAAQRAAGTRGWALDAWDTVFGDEEEEAARPDGAGEAGPGAAQGGGGRSSGASGRLRAGERASGGVLCDLVAMSAALAPYGFREWDVKTVDLDDWGGLQEGTLHAGFSAGQAQAMLATARGAGRAATPPELVPLGWRPPPMATNETAAGMIPGMSLTDPGVVLVPNQPRRMLADPGNGLSAKLPAPMVHALALAFRVPHGEPWHAMSGAFGDDGMLNPFIFWPLAIVAGAALLACGGLWVAAVSCCRLRPTAHAKKNE